MQAPEHDAQRNAADRWQQGQRDVSGNKQQHAARQTQRPCG